MKSPKTIVWFRKDLRTLDHPALWEASQRGEVIPVYIWSPDEELSEAAKCWLHYSLKALAEQLEQQGMQLIVRQGSWLSVLQETIAETRADAVYFTERYEPFIRERDQRIMNRLTEENIKVKSFHGNLLFPPESITNHQGGPYKVFTPFWKHCMNRQVPKPLPSPSMTYSSNKKRYSTAVEELGWVTGEQQQPKLLRYWTPGEAGAMRRLQYFVNEKLSCYKSRRDDLEHDHTSGLSPYLAFGELSPRWIWYTLLNQEVDEIGENGAAFLRQLVWREFSYHQLIHQPDCIETPIRPEYNAFPWENNEQLFLLWQQGQTGYPLIDAGMRELRETGCMHNRVRMIAASFLVKQLLIPWTKGAVWFKEALVDFDLANNTMGWQWVSGCGTDAAPYFRIFNPVLQGQKFDPDGTYVRKWVPELSKLPSPAIHQPWKAAQGILHDSGVVLGRTYPYPIIEHHYARQRALDAYQWMKDSTLRR